MALMEDVREDIQKAEGIIKHLQFRLKTEDLNDEERETLQQQLDATISGKATLEMLLEKEGG